MKTRMMTALVLTMLVLTACSKDKEMLPDHQEDPNAPVLPVGDAQMWPTPTINDSDLQGEGYNYDYWREHKTEAKTGDELLAMCNIPNQLLKNMSTPNLAWTCFHHPYNQDWAACNNIYDGILSVMTRSNGYQELMKRKGGAEAALDIYTQLTFDIPGVFEGKTTVNSQSLLSWTLVLCSAADYRAFNYEQIVRLAKEVRQKFMTISVSSTMVFEGSRITSLLGAFIAYHYDPTLPEEQRVLLANYIRYSCSSPYVSEDLSRSIIIIYSSLDRIPEIYTNPQNP